MNNNANSSEKGEKGKIEILGFGQGNSRASYRMTVNLPAEPMTDEEIITRCDNRTVDLNEPMGKCCHFGGYVTREAHSPKAVVTVWVD